MTGQIRDHKQLVGETVRTPTGGIVGEVRDIMLGEENEILGVLVVDVGGMDREPEDDIALHWRNIEHGLDGQMITELPPPEVLHDTD